MLYLALAAGFVTAVPVFWAERRSFRLRVAPGKGERQKTEANIIKLSGIKLPGEKKREKH